MKKITDRIQSYLRNGLTLFAAVALLLSAAFLTGCDETESAAADTVVSPQRAIGESDAETGMQPPTLEEITATISLTNEQKSGMETALNSLESLGRARRGQDGAAPPLHLFLETSSELLDDDQLVQLIDLLVARRDEERVERSELNQQEMESRHQESVEEMVRKLDLTEEQETAFRALFDQHREEMQAIHESVRAGEAERSGFHNRFRELREELNEKLEAILEPEQIAMLEEMRDENPRAGRKSGRRERQQDLMSNRMERHAQEKIDFLTKVLSLDESQQQELKSVTEEIRNRMQSLHKEARESGESPGQHIKEAVQMRENEAEAIRGILTPEQSEIFDSLQNLTMGHGPMHHSPR